jgi:hypothetical protein
MVKVCVLQTDNRPSLNYLLETYGYLFLFRTIVYI